MSSWRKDVLIEHRMEHEQIPKYFGIRNQQYVYANYYEQNPPYEYLHDLDKDPDQLLNLVGDQDYQEKLVSLRKKCEQMEMELNQNQ